MSEPLSQYAIERRLWDIAIIGSGIGGGTTAYALSRAGKSVLVIERGRLSSGNVGEGAAAQLNRAKDHQAPKECLKNSGKFWDDVEDISRAKAQVFQPAVGNTVGGSSRLYGMTFERFYPEDFSPGEYCRNAPEANVPPEWPIPYSEMEPYYAKAEQLYRVRGTPDPLRREGHPYCYLPPPPLSPSNVEVFEILTRNRLHPYRQPMACEYKTGCRECLGTVCPNACKNDSFTRCVLPAVRDFGAVLLEDCDVTYLEANRTKVTAIRCIYHGSLLTIRAATIVLSAGAMQTPALLQRSRSSLWPNGVANRHDQVGRNLMKHFVDLFIVQPARRSKPGELAKQISFNDFYVSDGTKLGAVQSLGPTPSGQAAVNHLERGLLQTAPWLKPMIPLARPVARVVAQKLLNGALVFAGILEDFPYPENRITFDSSRSRICLSYRIHEEALQRLKLFRSLCRSAFNPLPARLMKLAHNSWILGHQVGTCRFGSSPKDSVIDRNCRAHELDNLYVVDGSFLPTSGGINPSLTIAANALRVSDKIAH